MSNNDTNKNRTWAEAREDMEEMGHTVADAVKGIVPQSIAKREAMKSARNPHVAALTIGRSVWVRGELVKPSNEERAEMEFHIRRMWAITLLANMQDHGFSWEGIRKLTGKTRQTWNNVTSSGYVVDEVLQLPTDNPKRQQAIKGQRYRPVTNGFIRGVCESIEANEYTVFTKHFARMFTHGLTVWNNDLILAPRDKYVCERLGKEGREYVDEMSGVSESWFTAIETFDGGIKTLDQMPLLGIDEFSVDQHNVWEYDMDVELAAYGYANEETEEPSPKAKTAHEYWDHMNNAEQYFDEMPVPTDPNQFRDGEVANTPSQQNREDLTRLEAASKGQHQPSEFLNFSGPRQKGMELHHTEDGRLVEVPQEQNRKLGGGVTIKRDDGTPPNADIGGFWVQLPRTEVLPHMINGQNQVAFNVVIQLDDNNKPTGSVVVHNPKGGFTIQGM